MLYNRMDTMRFQGGKLLSTSLLYILDLIGSYNWRKLDFLLERLTCVMANSKKMFFFFCLFVFLETVYFHQPDFHFGASSTSVWKNSLRPLGGGSYPFRGLGSGGCRPVFSGRLSTPVFCWENNKKAISHIPLLL